VLLSLETLETPDALETLKMKLVLSSMGRAGQNFKIDSNNFKIDSTLLKDALETVETLDDSCHLLKHS